MWGDEPSGENSLVCVRVADFDRVQLRVSLREPTFRSFERGGLKSRLLQRGDLLLEKSGGGNTQPVGAVVLYDLDTPAVCSNFIARMPVAPGHDPRFLTYLHAAAYAAGINQRCIKQNTGIQNLDSDAYLSEIAPIPPLLDQLSIAGFLDRETAKLDALIVKKERLLALLEEKRTALITQAVTKGLDPAVPMKESGVEWLGEVPAHWDVKRLKYLLTEPLTYGASEAAEFSDPECPRFIRITDIREDGTLKDETFKSLPEDIAQPFLLRTGDLLLARSGATVGKSFRYNESWGRAAFAGYLIRARVNERTMSSRFVECFTQSSCYWDWLGSSFIKATIQNVSAERYADLFVPVPPREEQEKILSQVDSARSRIGELSVRVRNAITLLREYRTALISATVTGQIDVTADVS